MESQHDRKLRRQIQQPQGSDQSTLYDSNMSFCSFPYWFTSMYPQYVNDIRYLFFSREWRQPQMVLQTYWHIHNLILRRKIYQIKLCTVMITAWQLHQNHCVNQPRSTNRFIFQLWNVQFSTCLGWEMVVTTAFIQLKYWFWPKTKSIDWALSFWICPAMLPAYQITNSKLLVY